MPITDRELDRLGITGLDERHERVNRGGHVWKHAENGTRKYPFNFAEDSEGANDGRSRAADCAVSADAPIYVVLWNNGKRSVYRAFPSRTFQLMPAG